MTTILNASSDSQTPEQFAARLHNLKIQRASLEIKRLLQNLLVSITEENNRIEALRDQARKDFEAMPNGEVNGMIAKDAKRKEADALGLLYLRLWRVFMDCTVEIRTYASPKPVDRSVGHGFEDLYCDGAGQCISDADGGL